MCFNYELGICINCPSDPRWPGTHRPAAGDMRAAAILGLKWGASWPEVLPASMTRFPAGDDPIPSSAGLDTVGAVLESAAPTKSAAGAGDESGQSTARRERPQA